MRLRCPDIGQPDGPRMRTERNHRQMARNAWRANKDQMLAIRRPPRRRITINAWRNVAHILSTALSYQIQNCDECVISAPGPESDVLPVWSPLRVALFSTQLGELARGLVTRNIRNPQMVLAAHPYRHRSIGRKLNILAILLAAAHIAEQALLTALQLNSPHLLLWFFN